MLQIKKKIDIPGRLKPFTLTLQKKIGNLLMNISSTCFFLLDIQFVKTNKWKERKKLMYQLFEIYKLKNGVFKRRRNFCWGDT